jgi:hypothetical protein
MVMLDMTDGHLPWAMTHQGLGPAPPPHFVQTPNFIPVGPPPSYPGTPGGNHIIPHDITDY